jgi:hypothetical protein
LLPLVKLQKHFIYILLSFIVHKSINAQVYSAGTIYPYYYDITPDTLLNFNIAGSHIDDENYYIDVNGDLISDLRLRAYALGGIALGWGYIRVIALNPNISFRWKRYDVPTGKNVALPLNINDSINAKVAVWDTTQLMIAHVNKNMSGTFRILDWDTINDLYIGVKYESLSDTIFGWVRVNTYQPDLFNYRCLLKDFSFQSIFAGIEERQINKIKIYPNPASNILKISVEQNNSQISEIEIINYLGQTVLKTEFKNQIDVSGFANGFYTLLLKDNSGSVITKKIIKE